MSEPTGLSSNISRPARRHDDNDTGSGLLANLVAEGNQIALVIVRKYHDVAFLFVSHQHMTLVDSIEIDFIISGLAGVLIIIVAFSH